MDVQRGKDRSNIVCLGIPGKIIERFSDRDIEMARVDFGGIRKEVCVEHVPEAIEGDYVLVHVGFALQRIDEREAQRTFELLAELAQLDELVAPSDLEDSPPSGQEREP